jgi:hypothetical protein
MRTIHRAPSAKSVLPQAKFPDNSQMTGNPEVGQRQADLLGTEKPEAIHCFEKERMVVRDATPLRETAVISNHHQNRRRAHP